MIGTIISLLAAGLNLWAEKEKNKYIDELLAIKKGFWEEWNKPEGERSDAVLDSLKFRLEILAEAFLQKTGKPVDA